MSTPSYIDHLRAARDRYAAELAARQGPPDVRWDEYERWLLEQIRQLSEAILQAQQAGDVDGASGASPVWIVSQVATD